MKHIKRLLFAVVLLASSCREEAPELMNPNDRGLINTPSQVFETFWHAMNNSYVFWDIDPTDWDKVYDDYLPRFRELDELETIENETLQDLYTEICKDLIDHHYSLKITNARAPKDAETNIIMLQPWMNEVMERDYFHYYFSRDAYNACIAKYRSEGRISDFAEGWNDQMYACSYNIDDGIIYLSISAFRISKADPDNPEDTVMEAIDNYRRLVLETPDIKGVILDVRGNSGGNNRDLNIILGPLIDEEFLMGYTRIKEGPGRLDYGPWVPIRVAPAAEHRKIEAPIVAVADILSISMAEITAIAVSMLPNGCVVGERTAGATCSLLNLFNFSYSGQIHNPYVDIYTSTLLMKDAEGTIYEGVGVTPDIEVLWDEEAMNAGTDVQLDRAIEYIHTGK